MRFELPRLFPLTLLLIWLPLAPAAHAFPFDLPPIDSIVQYQPKQPLQVFTADGVDIGQFGAERREYLPLARMPKTLQQAVLAVEDARFYEHSGVDPKGMARAALAMITGGMRQGASTITQQLVRTMLLTREFTAERKAKEIALAFKVEQALSKDRILEIYLNEIYLGQRAYGFASAARTYFGKPLDQLHLAEFALLAGLPQNPHYANPVANLDRAVQRQRVVLQRMLTVGAISQAQWQQARDHKLVIRPPGQRPVMADHVAEMARRVVVERYGTEAYQRGIRVYTSLRSAEQQAAHQAVQKGLLVWDQRQPWRGPEDLESLPETSGEALHKAAIQALRNHKDDETLRLGVVLQASAQAVVVQLATGDTVTLQGSALDRVRASLQAKAPAAHKLQRGSVVRLVQDGGQWRFGQWPEAEAALVALDPQTGKVRAMVGGFDFGRRPFNHATQAWRQPGSAFKPFVWSAALEERVMPATVVDDLPFTAANGWNPGNSNDQFAGPISARRALAISSNLVSVRLLQHTGVQRARDWSARFGFDAARQPQDLTLSLGTGSVTPLHMARGYAAFANGGWRVNPLVIERIVDAQGKVLFEAPTPEPLTEANRAIPERNAFVMGQLMADVTRSGTAARAAAALGRSDIMGKTGTTSDALDAWFAGYHPSVVAVAWVGHSTPKSLGERESGGRLALPIWIDFMTHALKSVPLATPVAPAGVALIDGDWRYTEWANGGWVSALGDSSGAVYAPTTIPEAAAPGSANPAAATNPPATPAVPAPATSAVPAPVGDAMPAPVQP
jgi:penicillin-binding protein 1A